MNRLLGTDGIKGDFLDRYLVAVMYERTRTLATTPRIHFHITQLNKDKNNDFVNMFMFRFVVALGRVGG